MAAERAAGEELERVRTEAAAQVAAAPAEAEQDRGDVEAERDRVLAERAAESRREIEQAQTTAAAQVATAEQAEQAAQDARSEARTQILAAQQQLADAGSAQTRAEADRAAADRRATEDLATLERVRAELEQLRTDHHAELATVGDTDAPPVKEHTWIQSALTSAHALALAVEHGSEIYRRVAPLNAATQTALSTEHRVAEFATAVAAARRAGIHTLVTSPADKHELATGLDIEPATDIHYLLHSHETYLGLVISAGWTMEEYKAWLYLTLCEQLLVQAGHHRRRPRNVLPPLSTHLVHDAGRRQGAQQVQSEGLITDDAR